MSSGIISNFQFKRTGTLAQEFKNPVSRFPSCRMSDNFEGIANIPSSFCHADQVGRLYPEPNHRCNAASPMRARNIHGGSITLTCRSLNCRWQILKQFYCPYSSGD
jgi:hypothetical protein